MDFEAEAKAIIDKILYGAGFDFDEFTADTLRRAYEAGVAAGKDSCAWMEPLVYRGDA